MIKFFRKYEKQIFWFAVVPTLLVFPVTGVMLSTCSQRDRESPARAFGSEIPAEDFAQVQARLGAFVRAHGQQNMDRERVWEHIVFLQRAREAGVRVSDDELIERIHEFYRRHESYKLAYQKFQSDPQYEQLRQFMDPSRIIPQLAEAEFARTTFDEQGYRDLLRQFDASPADFEMTLREQAMIEKLFDQVQASGKVAPDKIWEAYERENQKRKADYVLFRAEDYSVETATPSAEELRKHYDKNAERFREPVREDVEWVAVQAAAFEGQIAQPTDAEIAARYEAYKPRYRIDRPAPAPVTGTAEAPTATAEPQYRPLDEVKADLAAEIRTDRKLEMARRKAEEIRGRVLADLTAGKPVSLTAVAEEAGARHGRSGLIEHLEFLGQREISFYNVLNTITALRPQGAASLSGVVPHNDKVSAFFLRLVERRESRVPPFEEVEARVRESYVRGLDEEVRQHWQTHQDKFAKPATAAVEWIHVPFAKFERALPAGTTGTAAEAELRKRAEELIAEVRKAVEEPGPDGKPRDLETVALDKGVEHGRATVQQGGKDAPAAIQSAELSGYLSDDARLKAGTLSPAFEDEAKKGLSAVLVRSRTAEKRLDFAEVKEEARKDLLADRAYARATDAADAFHKEVVARPAEFRAVAERRKLKVAETDFLGQKDKAKDVPETLTLVGALFAARELGDVADILKDQESKTAAVMRWVAKQPADPAGFAAAEADIRKRLEWMAQREAAAKWALDVRLEAREVAEKIVEEVYGLRYGPDGTAEIEAGHIYVAADATTIRSELEKRAKAAADAALAEVRGGKAFDTVAAQKSEDRQTASRGGLVSSGYLARGKLPRDSAAAQPEVEAILFGLKDGEVGGPVRSKLGWHLVKADGRRGEEVRARHILFRTERDKGTDGELAPLPAEVRAAAMAKAREKIDKARARLDAGDSFAAVARDLSEEPFSGDKRPYELMTAFELTALATPLDEMSPVVAGDDGRVHLLFVEKAGAREGQGRTAVQPRLVHHIQKKGDAGRKELEEIRADLASDRRAIDESTGRTGGLRAAALEFRERFEEEAKDESEAPSAVRGGRVGIFRESADLARWGPAFRDAMYKLKDGEVSGIVEGLDGWHIVKVYGRVKKPYDEARKDVAAPVLEGLEF